jgi:hypothetical protein
MDGKDAEDVKKDLKKTVDPRDLGVNIKKMYNTRNGLVLELDKPESVEKFLYNEDLRDAGYTCTKQTLKSPMIMVYDVPKTMTEDDVKEDLYGRNIEDQVTRQDFLDGFVVKHKYKTKTRRGEEPDKENWVVQCTGPVRNAIRQRDRLYLGWEVCRVKDYIDIARCYKCQVFGHVAKVCRSKVVVCSYCSGPHSYKDCKHTQDTEKVKCANCAKTRNRDDHDAGWRRCPVYEREVSRYLQKIDYGI